MSGDGLLKRMQRLYEPEVLTDEAEPDPVDDSEIDDADRAPLPTEENCPHCRHFISHQTGSSAPQLILDRDLRVRWRNAAYSRFRETPGITYNYRERTFDDFFTTLTGDSPESKIHRTSLFSALEDSGVGFSWQGLVEGLGPNMIPFVAVLTIKPLALEDSGDVRYFEANIHDITADYQGIVHSSFESILEASLLKDEDTGNHIRRVNAYSRLIAEGLLEDKQNGDVRWIDIDRSFISDIGELAAFHDVGKIGTPDSVLLKKGELNDEERAVMKEHAINGALILSSYPKPMVREIARSHHERWDGTGYPSSDLYPEPLKGDSIPLSGRIVALADVYDALRTRRPYKEPFSEEQTVSIIVKSSGSHLDPGIVAKFRNLRKEFDRVARELAD